MSEKKNLIEIIESTDMFSVFARLMRTSGLNELIGGSGPFTMFVPTNDAFRMVPDKVMNGWLSEKSQDMLRRVLAYHIVADKLMAANLGLSASSASSISGGKMTFTDDHGLRVNKAGILARNIDARDGIIHAIDTVLTPPAELTSSSAEKVEAAWGGKEVQITGDLAPAKQNGHAEGRKDDALHPEVTSRQPIPITSWRPASKIAPSPEGNWKLS